MCTYMVCVYISYIYYVTQYSAWCCTVAIIITALCDSLDLLSCWWLRAGNPQHHSIVYVIGIWKFFSVNKEKFVLNKWKCIALITPIIEAQFYHVFYSEEWKSSFFSFSQWHWGKQSLRKMSRYDERWKNIIFSE
jgi:hypothetical protein